VSSTAKADDRPEKKAMSTKLKMILRKMKRKMKRKRKKIR